MRLAQPSTPLTAAALSPPGESCYTGFSKFRSHPTSATPCDEWKAYAAELFDSADAGHKGFVSTDEFATIIKTDRMFETADFKYWDANHAQ